MKPTICVNTFHPEELSCSSLFVIYNKYETDIFLPSQKKKKPKYSFGFGPKKHLYNGSILSQLADLNRNLKSIMPRINQLFSRNVHKICYDHAHDKRHPGGTIWTHVYAWEREETASVW